MASTYLDEHLRYTNFFALTLIYNNKFITGIEISMIHPKQPSVQQTIAQLRPKFLELFPMGHQVSLLCAPKPVDDDPTKLLISSRSGKSLAVALISPSHAPKLVARGMDLAEEIRGVLDSELGSVILPPLAQGQLENHESYTVLPFHTPMSNNRIVFTIQKRIFSKSILGWLLAATKQTVCNVPPNELNESFKAPLKHIANIGFSADIKKAALLALERIDKGIWTPKYSFYHGDLWSGNILLSKNSKNKNYAFKLIDWPGARLKGYAFFDLIRISNSLSINTRTLRKQVRAHTVALGCKDLDSIGYLLASLGYIGMNLENFSPSNYERMTNICYARLKNVII